MLQLESTNMPLSFFGPAALSPLSLQQPHNSIITIGSPNDMMRRVVAKNTSLFGKDQHFFLPISAKLSNKLTALSFILSVTLTPWLCNSNAAAHQTLLVFFWFG